MEVKYIVPIKKYFQNEKKIDIYIQNWADIYEGYILNENLRDISIINPSKKVGEKPITVQFFKKWYLKFNRLYFNGNLPDIQILFQSSSGKHAAIGRAYAEISFISEILGPKFTTLMNRIGGKKIGKLLGRFLGKNAERFFIGHFINGVIPVKIKINSYYAFSEYQAMSVLLHEMIHIYEYTMYPNHLKQDRYRPHGEWFKKQCLRLNEYGWNIWTHDKVNTRHINETDHVNNDDYNTTIEFCAYQLKLDQDSNGEDVNIEILDDENILFGVM